MKVALVLPTGDDPAHLAVRRGLGAALRARGHRLVRENAEVVHVQAFPRRCRALASARVHPKSALVVTWQGAALGLADDRRALFALLRRAHAVSAVSRAGAAELRAALPRLSVAVTPNGAAPGPAPRRRAGPDILTVGRLAAFKGLDVLGLALAGLDARWTAVGPDQTGGRLRRFLRRLGLAVRLPGTLPPARVRALMASCRVFVQPSRAEGMPMALLEAMAAGAPCVAADAGGCREALGRAGLLIPASDVRALSGAVSRLLGDGSLARRLGAAARRRSASFAWSAAAGRCERLYKVARARAGA